MLSVAPSATAKTFIFSMSALDKFPLTQCVVFAIFGIVKFAGIFASDTNIPLAVVITTLAAVLAVVVPDKVLV